MELLTKRQEDVLDFLGRFIRENGYPPTIREIRDAFHLRSNRGVIDHLRALERKGRIRRGRASSRAIEIMGRDAKESSRAGAACGAVTYPIAGKIAAGLPAPPIEESGEGLILDESLFGETGDFVLEVRGDSMIGDHILSGDLLVVKRSRECAPGDIVVALVGGETTVKRYVETRDGAVLQPSNPRYEPIRLSACEAMSPEVIGTVVGVIRRVQTRPRPFSG